MQQSTGVLSIFILKCKTQIKNIMIHVFFLANEGKFILQSTPGIITVCFPCPEGSVVPGPSQIIPQNLQPVWDSSCVLTFAQSEFWTLNSLYFQQLEAGVWGADSNLEWIRAVTQSISCWEKPRCSGAFACEPACRFLGCRLIDPCLPNLILIFSLPQVFYPQIIKALTHLWLHYIFLQQVF